MVFWQLMRNLYLIVRHATSQYTFLSEENSAASAAAILNASSSFSPSFSLLSNPKAH